MSTAGSLSKKERQFSRGTRAVQFSRLAHDRSEVMPRLSLVRNVLQHTVFMHVCTTLHPWLNHPDRRGPPRNKSTVRNSRTTVSGPAEPDASTAGDVIAEKAAGTQDLASAIPFNPNKAAEYDPVAALAPPEGASVKPADPVVGASTVTELNGLREKITHFDHERMFLGERGSTDTARDAGRSRGRGTHHRLGENG